MIEQEDMTTPSGEFHTNLVNTKLTSHWSDVILKLLELGQQTSRYIYVHTIEKHTMNKTKML